MIACSSHRPHSKDATYATNQIAAHASWARVFKMIFYFGQPEEALMDAQTRFARIQGGDGWPTIREMISFLAGQPDWAVLVNADIIVTEKLKGVVRHMEQRGIPAATSRRWQFKASMDDADVTDRGLDIFIAKPWLWQSLSKEIPTGYRFGHCEWDTWVLGKLMQRTHWKMGDFTPSRCVFHPVHEGRNMPLNEQVPKMLETIYDYAKLPGVKIRI